MQNSHGLLGLVMTCLCLIILGFCLREKNVFILFFETKFYTIAKYFYPRPVLRVSKYGKVRWRCDILVLVHNVWVFFLNWNAIFLTTPMFLCSAKNVTNWVDFSRSTATLQLVCPPDSSSLSPPKQVSVRHLESEISLLLIKWNQFLPLICS